MFARGRRRPVRRRHLCRIAFSESLRFHEPGIRRSGAPRLERLSGLEAISALLDETYILAYAATMGLSPQIFKSVAELARTVAVSRLIRPRGFEHMDAVLNLIECDVRTPQPVSPTF